MYPLNISNHAEFRIQNRGFRNEVIFFLLMFGDSSPCGGGCEKVFIGRRGLQLLLSSNNTPCSLKKFIKKNYDKLAKKALIIGHAIVTVINQ